MKYALIVNGDTEGRHLGNVEQALKVLKAQGFETFVASPSKPVQPADHYAAPTRQKLQELVAGLKAKIGGQDELVIYTTGHGDKAGEAGSVCLADGCDYDTVAPLLDGIPYGRRTVVMDQCYGGNWNARFLDDPKTLFITPGSKNEQVCCQEFAPRFWAEAVPDENGDGTISWQERYANAVADRVLSSLPQFVPSPGYVQAGVPPFKPEVREIADEARFKAALKTLKPGQYAIVTFSADWCGPCKEYKPVFERIAKEAGGQHLFLRTENPELAKGYKVFAYPTVMVIAASGHTLTVEDRGAPLQKLAQFFIPIDLRFKTRIAAAEKIANDKDRTWVLVDIAWGLVKAGLKDQAVPVFQKALAAAEKTAHDKDHVWIFQGIALGLVKAGLKDKVPIPGH